MDHEPATNTLYVHAIAASDRRDVVAPIRRLEDYALRIFDEPADPGDGPPGRSGPPGAGPPDDPADDPAVAEDDAHTDRDASVGDDDADPDRDASVGGDANPDRDASAGDDATEGHPGDTGGHADGE
jgi:hypothetical protein